MRNMRNNHKFLDTLKCSIDRLDQEVKNDGLFTVEKLEELAHNLAHELVVGLPQQCRRKSLKSDLKKNKKLLDSAYQTLVSAMQSRQTVSPASEWFVDNFHHIQDQLQEINLNLTHKYYRHLPVILEGELTGYPRVYAIALSFIAHTDNQLNPKTLESFLHSYQKVTPLLMSEIWALVMTFRVVLIQHLTIKAMRLIYARFGKEKADTLAEQLFEFIAISGVNEADITKFLDNNIHDFARARRAFIVRLTQRLRDQNSDVSTAYDWIEDKLKKFSTTTEKLTQKEIHIQATSQTSVGNIISSMRTISSLDWKVFFERVNLIDPILSKDHDKVFQTMDFTSKDSYRHSVERVAHQCKITEQEVAQIAVIQKGDLGYHLLGSGLAKLKKKCGFEPTSVDRIKDYILLHPTSFYLGSLILLVLALIAPLLKYHLDFGGGPYLATAIVIIALILMTEFALSFINLYVAYFIKPVPLPRIDPERALSIENTTMVVVPTLFNSRECINKLIERLEIHALANSEENIFFALLSDYGDALQENTAHDKELTDYANEKIKKLNERYCQKGVPIFYLFHRKRLWNEKELKWMGWERKRGKLSEFNRLIRGATDTSFIIHTAPMELCQKIKYVITLDSDTQMPRGSAKKLISTIIHPLNVPTIDLRTRQVVSGYGILQPRISITSSSALQTFFAKISSGNTGHDPYTTAVSDVYQDLFAEGSFTGKGLYVVDAFEQSLNERAPENLILSHDLFEGIFARCALVSDVELFDDYPADYDTYIMRAHRWTRGDWQISLWLFPWVINAKNNWVKNHISLLSKWKILDNLRRSLVPMAALIWLLLAWTILPGPAEKWTFIVLLVFLFPVFAPFANGNWMQKGNITWEGHLSSCAEETKTKLLQILMTIAFLPSQAWVQCDAITKAIFRILFSKKHLLDWNPFSQKKIKKIQLGLKDFLDPLPLCTFFIFLFMSYFRPTNLVVASPFLLFWFFSSWMKKLLHHKAKKKPKQLNQNERMSYRSYARSTWYFFERFVSHQGNWLAPDNFQENPKPVVAYRTSPTNIGLQLLSYACAYDLGYIGHGELLKKLSKTFDALEKLPKFKGHFLNWYNIETLTPLHPRYVSTVDSGNLAGHLICFKQFLYNLSDSKRDYKILRSGLEDTVNLIKTQSKLLHQPSSIELSDELTECVEILFKEHQSIGISTNEQWRHSLKDFFDCTLELEAGLEDLSMDKETLVIRDLFHRLINQVTELQKDLETDEKLHRQLEGLLIKRVDSIINKMNFKFLFDEKRKLFFLGFHVDNNHFDHSYYDLLASEARLASFVAISKGDIPLDNWFRLGRQIAAVKGVKVLTSWSASMFEYLMPLLVMKRYENTLLEQTYNSVLKRQIQYGKDKKVPWGISESAYNARDLQMNYQYGPFGVPGLGLKRGLSNELVVSPYSTMLAAMVDPHAALANLEKLARLGAYSTFGFYEAIDYTVERIPTHSRFVVIQSYMAHHQGMSLISINNILNKNIMQKRFHQDPSIKATELLLQERIPKPTELTMPRKEEVDHSGFLHSLKDFYPREYDDVNLSLPRTQILSNGQYSTMLTSTGSGFSKWGDFYLSRWREDATRDHWGQYYYLRSQSLDKTWCATFQPLLDTSKKITSDFAEDRVHFYRADKNLTTKTEIIVSPEDSVELRMILITNESPRTQEVELTSFMELALATLNDDKAHPSFSKLFIQTKLGDNKKSLLATRRRRSKEEIELWGFHTVSCDHLLSQKVEFETSRAHFLGRGRTAQNPKVFETTLALSGTTGSVLDPIFSLRVKLMIKTGETVKVVFASGMTDSESKAQDLIQKYSEFTTYKRESEMAWTQAQIQLRHQNINPLKAHLYQKIAGRLIYLDRSLRPSSETIKLNTRTQKELWRFGISGDHPVALIELHHQKDIHLFKDLLQAHEYLRLKGIVFDLVVINLNSAGYLLTLQDELLRQLRMSSCHGLLNKHGGVFLLRIDLMAREDLLLLKTIARVIFKGELGYLEDQLNHRKPRVKMPSFLKVKKEVPAYKNLNLIIPKLDFFNSFGGFDRETFEYKIILKDQQWTPAPWINVVSNSLDFGFFISESGSSHTWSVNSRENRMTPWFNDPISDPTGEALYIRDELTGEFWSATPLPIRLDSTYLISHGQGYSRFQHISKEIEHTLKVFVMMSEEMKVSELTLRNHSNKTRILSVMNYIEWVQGVHREDTAAHLVSDYDKETRTLLIQNSYNNEFSSRVSYTFMSSSIAEVSSSFTCDRREFLGRNGDHKSPKALKRKNLSNSYGAALDPCTAWQSVIEIPAGQEVKLYLLTGQTHSKEKAIKLIQIYGNAEALEKSFKDVLTYWNTTLKKVEIQTPDLSLNTLVNRWLPYQILSCRIWGRTAMYQSGGAFGFRDQLQDVMAMVYSHPIITRQQILIHARRQFIEGDVQHWWHPPTGRGVRTRFSDDLLWLPFVVNFYLRVTGDQTILDEVLPFLEAPRLDQHQEDAYLYPEVSDEAGTLFEHCARAIDKSLAVGIHGLPLMGTGDWNDGMNRVGHQGLGESIWVGWFLHQTLTEFLPVCEKREENKRLAIYKEYLKNLKCSLEEEAWDGQWYKRAFFDDGTPMGSAKSDECQIDSLSQSWAVLSQAGYRERAEQAMEEVEKSLINWEDQLIKLFTPAFDLTDHDPGYIKGYLPGVRENAGQYTHAAIWVVMAYAKLGRGEMATKLFHLLNPINHSLDKAGVEKYKTEPYVLAADVYANKAHAGRGGWSWYTGSASWMYRAALESILGFEKREDQFRVCPQVPSSWDEYRIHYHYKETHYQIVLKRGSSSLKYRAREWITMINDGENHFVEIGFN